VAWGDYDNDLDLDLFICNDIDPEVLLRNDGGGIFTDVTPPELANAGRADGPAWGDYDNDGDLDLYVTNQSEPNKLFRNDGGGSFTDVSVTPLNDAGDGHGCAWADYNEDGLLDLYVCNASDQPDRLFQNQEDNGYHWLHIDLVGRVSNAAGIGVRALAVAGGLRQIREVSGGSGYMSQNSLTLEFGLATATVVDSLYIFWHRGDLQILTDIAVDQRISVVEPPRTNVWTDIADGGPLADPGSGQGAAWGDYDGDGDPDLYLANQGANKLFSNEGDGTFADVTSAPLDDAGNGFGTTWGDYDDDGDLDLYLSNWGASNRLLRNDGAGVFSDTTAGPLAGAGFGHAAARADYDHDSDLDLYLANTTANQPLRNDGRRRSRSLHLEQRAEQAAAQRRRRRFQRRHRRRSRRRRRRVRRRLGRLRQ